MARQLKDILGMKARGTPPGNRTPPPKWPAEGEDGYLSKQCNTVLGPVAVSGTGSYSTKVPMLRFFKDCC